MRTLPRSDKPNQLLHILEVIIIPIEALAVVYNPPAFVLGQAVQQRVNAITLGKQAESVGLDLRQQPLAAVLLAFAAVGDLPLQ